MSVEMGGVVGRCVTLNLEEYCLAAAAGGYKVDYKLEEYWWRMLQ